MGWVELKMQCFINPKMLSTFIYVFMYVYLFQRCWHVALMSSSVETVLASTAPSNVTRSMTVLTTVMNLAVSMVSTSPHHRQPATALTELTSLWALVMYLMMMIRRHSIVAHTLICWDSAWGGGMLGVSVVSSPRVFGLWGASGLLHVKSNWFLASLRSCQLLELFITAHVKLFLRHFCSFCPDLVDYCYHALPEPWVLCLVCKDLWSGWFVFFTSTVRGFDVVTDRRIQSPDTCLSALWLQILVTFISLWLKPEL